MDGIRTLFPGWDGDRRTSLSRPFTALQHISRAGWIVRGISLQCVHGIWAVHLRGGYGGRLGVIIRNLVRMDSRLANFVSRIVSYDLYDGEFDSHECASHFLIEPVDVIPICPLTRMTCRLWVAVLYFLIVKVVIAALGAAALCLVVILPVLAIGSGGEAPHFANQETFGGSSILYTVVLVFVGLVGAFGLPIVAKLSTKTTKHFCGEWKSEQDQVSIQENNPSPFDNSTPSAEARATSFEDLEANKPGSSTYMNELTRT